MICASGARAYSLHLALLPSGSVSAPDARRCLIRCSFSDRYQIAFRLPDSLCIGIDTDCITVLTQSAHQRGALSTHGVQYAQRSRLMCKSRRSPGAVQHQVGEVRIGFAFVFEHIGADPPASSQSTRVQRAVKRRRPVAGQPNRWPNVLKSPPMPPRSVTCASNTKKGSFARYAILGRSQVTCQASRMHFQFDQCQLLQGLAITNIRMRLQKHRVAHKNLFSLRRIWTA